VTIGSPKLKGEITMTTTAVIIIALLILLFGGGDGYYSRRRPTSTIALSPVWVALRLQAELRWPSLELERRNKASERNRRWL